MVSPKALPGSLDVRKTFRPRRGIALSTSATP